MKRIFEFLKECALIFVIIMALYLVFEENARMVIYLILSYVAVFIFGFKFYQKITFWACEVDTEEELANLVLIGKQVKEGAKEVIENEKRKRNV